MSVLCGEYPRRKPGETHCARCGDVTHEPFDKRGPCEACGSNAWTTGLPMVWPPTLGYGAPAFLLGLSSPPLVDLPEDGPPPNGHSARSRGAGNGRSRLTMETVLGIREARTSGLTYRELMARFGISKRTVESIVRGESWQQDSE